MLFADALLAYLRSLPAERVVQTLTLAELDTLLGTPLPAEVHDVWYWERSATAQQLRVAGFLGVLGRDGDTVSFVRIGRR